MKINPKLLDAVAIFTELGWADATLNQAHVLPLGTDEQQKRALAGLRTGKWGSFGQLSPNTWGYKSAVTVDERMLALFALRVGVSAKRANELIKHDIRKFAIPIIEARGEQFVADFIKINSTVTSWWDSYSVDLVLRGKLEIPRNTAYIDNWAHVALLVFRDTNRQDNQLLNASLVTASFTEHLRVAVELSSIFLAPLLEEALKRDVIDRNQAKEAAFHLIALTQRPSDRKNWAEFLLDHLRLETSELLSKADTLSALVATSEPPMVERFAVPLIPLVTEDQLADIALSALYATTAKARRAVLKALSSRQVPSTSVIETLAPRLQELHNSHDKQTQKLTSKLLTAWEVSIETTTPEVDLNLWQVVPPVWQLPRFVRGTASVDTLSEALAIIAGRWEVYDASMERFLALACELALTDPVGTERVLRGAKRIFNGMLSDWADGTIKPWARLARRNENLHSARAKAVITHLGTIPCLLSEPSDMDLSITAADFNERLACYAAEDIRVLEPDFVLALARIKPEQRADLDELAVQIELDDGTTFARSAKQIIRAFKVDPFQEPELKFYRGLIKAEAFYWPKSLAKLPKRLRVTTWDSDVDFTVFPHFGNAAYRCFEWAQFVDERLGPLAIQAAHAGCPLPPAGAMNLLAILRQKNKINEECVSAVRLAWQRGLLRPEAADYAYSDWQESPRMVAKLVAALVEVAHEGLLAVVWPILDQIIADSVATPKLAAGTAEAAYAMLEFAPIITAKGDETTWQVPGIRRLAARKGSAKAVVAAREVVAILPKVAEPITEVAADPPAPTALEDADFAHAWDSNECTSPIDDDVIATVRWHDSTNKPRQIEVLLDTGEHQFRVFKAHGWSWDLEHEYQCQAFTTADEEVYLRWDDFTETVAFSPHRNWRNGTDSPLTGRRQLLSQFMVTVVIAYLSDEKHAREFHSVLEAYCRQHRITPAAVSTAMQQALKFEGFSPARTLKILEKNPQYLSLLWPMLTEPITAAAQVVTAGGATPRWVNRVLDLVNLQLPVLLTATQKGFIPAEAWDGLTALSQMRKSTAQTKAAALHQVLG